MKSTMQAAFLFALSVLAVTVAAQDASSFPQCAQWCINSMQQANKSQELGCSAGDNACLCRNPNFTYGVRDCSAELCANLTTAGLAIGYTNDFCRGAGVELNTVTSGLPAEFTGTAPSGTGAAASATPVSTSAIVSTIVTDGSTITTTVGSSTIFGGGSGPGASGAASSMPVSTSAIVSTITTDGSTIETTIGSSTIFSTAAAGSGTTTLTSASAIVSTVTSGGSTFETTIGSSTFTTAVSSHAGSGTNSAGTSGTAGTAGSATSTTSPGFAPQMTAAPMGMLAAAGVAALLL